MLWCGMRNRNVKYQKVGSHPTYVRLQTSLVVVHQAKPYLNIGIMVIFRFFCPTDCNGNVFQIETADHITLEGLEHCASSLFEKGIIIITARGSIGKLVVVGTPMAMNQSCYALRSKTGEYEYLYFLTMQLIECLKAKGSGSVFKSIITSDIENSLLCIAPTDIITRFCKSVHHLFQKIKENTIEISNLTKLRDELLPLLMNGQVSLRNGDVSRHLRLRLGIVKASFPSALASHVNSDLSLQLLYIIIE